MRDQVGEMGGESTERDGWKGGRFSESGRNLTQGKLPRVYKDDTPPTPQLRLLEIVTM